MAPYAFKGMQGSVEGQELDAWSGDDYRWATRLRLQDASRNLTTTGP